MKHILFFIFLLYSKAACAQEPGVHSFAEILSIMNESKLEYSAELYDTNERQCSDLHDRLNDANHYQKVSGGEIQGAQYELTAELLQLMNKAEGYSNRQKYDSALRLYQKLIARDPAFSPAIVCLGHVCEKKHDNPNAIASYKKAISANYFDYKAHWLLADLYMHLGQNLNEAWDEITTAHILNRNHPLIKKSLENIYARSNMAYQNWCFEPVYYLHKEDTGLVQVQFTSVWFPYAAVKALWKYEPGYRQSMGSDVGIYSSLEDKEGLSCLATALSSDSTKAWQSIPALKGLMKAMEKGMFYEYLMYEITLRQYPATVYSLPYFSLDKIRKYIAAIHTGD